MSRETKIGILLLAGLAVLIFGYKFLKGQNILGSSQTFYVEYGNVDGLTVGSTVTNKGLEVGTVQDIEFTEDLTKLLVTLVLSGDVPVPQGTTADIVSVSVLGEKASVLDFNGNSCVTNPCVEDGSYLQGKSLGLLASFVDVDDAEQYTAIVEESLQNVVDSLNALFNSDSPMGESLRDFQSTLANLNSATGRLDRLMANNTRTFGSILNNVETLTDTLLESNSDIRAIAANAAALTADLAKIDFEGLGNGAGATIKDLRATLKKADAAVASLTAVLNKVNQGNGTIAKALNDDELYNNLQELTQGIALLTYDLRLQPERYRRILSKKTKTDPIRVVPANPEEEEQIQDAIKRD